MGKIRIIGGIHRSRQLPVLDFDGLRPTLDRVKETVFNWLGQDLTGLTCLDLFAGSGSLGFEAISRNAKQVIMIERNPKVAKQLEANRQLLRADNCQIINNDALNYLNSSQMKFDIVFVDPPYDSNLLQQSLPLICDKLNINGLVYIEFRDAVDLEKFVIYKQAKAGVVNYALLTLEEN